MWDFIKQFEGNTIDIEQESLLLILEEFAEDNVECDGPGYLANYQDFEEQPIIESRNYETISDLCVAVLNRVDRLVFKTIITAFLQQRASNTNSEMTSPEWINAIIVGYQLTINCENESEHMDIEQKRMTHTTHVANVNLGDSFVMESGICIRNQIIFTISRIFYSWIDCL